ncbi:inter-alpha-trypsin inhibitor heavy chain H6 [Pelobates cultripes]|uniref:Inter-alpha-trypsin inhibitor heavy chain H6 n=1 Tax=Pelobates cultripes TaxID=61616 RepID=A0AAD1WLS4_PELCU|nr:inter-alpha-trypsin inhibitor heavy chain H6 [Pelobates cultripes]
MLLRYFQNSFIMPRIGMLSSRCCVLFLMVILVHLTLIGWTRSESIYQQRFKRQSRASKTELTISSLFIQSTIVSRYAFTKVQTVMLNPHSEAKDAIFDLDLPSSAFISNFTLTVKGKTYIAEVKEKHQAKKMYEEARKQGKTTAHVGTRDTEKFRVMVNVEAGGEIGFTLTYEELLRRQLGKYEHAVSVRPGQIVQNLSVEVTISERTGIEYVQVLPLRTSRLMTNAVRGETKVPPSTKLEKGPHCARVIFSPSPAQQTAQSSSGIAADFVIQYDVALKDLAGDVQIYNGYFVHYFAPRGLPTIQKNVIFVIDVSGSMFGTKMKQTKSAMHVILNDLHRDDFFNIITFSDVVQVWKPGHSIQASAQNVKSAKEYVNTIEANGWTDINAALLAAASVFNQTSPKQVKGAKPRIPLIIFLTDGEATSGVTSTNRILDNVHKAMGENISLFCLAFGEDADYNLMRRLSLENRGIARRIYEYSDATLQLKGFYDEIASPLLFDIELAYLGETTYNVTQTLFPNYFQGSELVVTGKLRPGTKNLKVHMTAHDHKAQLSLQNDITMEDNATQDSFGCSGNIDEIQWFVQRLWAYFTIQDLLQARIKANDTVARRLLTEKATNLSLKYNFVTPVTSLIVVKPEDPEDTTTQAATTSTETTTTTISSTFSTISTVASTSTAVSTNKITGGSQVTKPFTKNAKPSATSIISTIRPTSPKTTIRPTSPKTTIRPTSPKITIRPTSPKTTIRPTSPKTTVRPTSPRTTSRPTSSRTTIRPTSPGTTISAVTGSKDHAGITAGPTTIPSTFEKLTLVSPTNYSLLTPHPDSHHNIPRNSTSSIPPQNILSVAPTKDRADESPSIILTSIRPASFSTVPVAESRTELLSETLSPPSEVTSLFMSEHGAEVTSDPTSPIFFPSPLRLLILPDEELYHEVTLPTFVESLHPPPMYSLLEEVSGETEMYDSDDLLYQKSFDDDEDFDMLLSGVPGLQTFMSSVDGDPHFVVNLPRSQEKLCFTLDGRPGDILRLVSDSSTGITVNGHLMQAPFKIGSENRIRTYLDIITIIVNQTHANYIINISLNTLTLKGEDQLSLPLNHPAFLQKPRLAIKVSPSSNVTIWIGHDVELLIMFHQYRHPTYLQLDHLGFYIVNGKGLSSHSAGLLGQFQNAQIEVTEKKESNELTFLAIVTRKNHTAPATLVLKSMKDSPARTHMSKCWLVKHGDIENILDGKYISYVVTDLQEL